MKVSVSTSLEEEIAKRVSLLAKEDMTSEAAIIRKCVVKHLPELEREVLGDRFVNGNGEPAAVAVEERA